MGEVVQNVVTQAGGADFVNFVLMMGAMFAILYFMLIRPQRKQQTQHQTLLSALKKGDEIILNSGFFAKVWAVEDQSLIVDIGDKTRVKILKSAVSTLANAVKTSSASAASTEGTPTAVPAAGDDAATSVATPKSKSKKKK